MEIVIVLDQLQGSKGMFENKNNGIIIYETEDGRTKVDVRLENEKFNQTRLNSNEKDDFDRFLEENKFKSRK